MLAKGIALVKTEQNYTAYGLTTCLRGWRPSTTYHNRASSPAKRGINNRKEQLRSGLDLPGAGSHDIVFRHSCYPRWRLNMRVADKFTPEVLIEAPRRGPAVPNTDGKLCSQF